MAKHEGVNLNVDYYTPEQVVNAGKKLLQVEQLNFTYDEIGDVLYADIGKPKHGILEEPQEGVFIKFDMDTNELIGFTISNYKRQLKDGHLKSIPHFPNVKLPQYSKFGKLGNAWSDLKHIMMGEVTAIIAPALECYNYFVRKT